MIFACVGMCKWARNALTHTYTHNNNYIWEVEENSGNTNIIIPDNHIIWESGYSVVEKNSSVKSSLTEAV